MNQEVTGKKLQREAVRGAPMRPMSGDAMKGGRPSGMAVVRLVGESSGIGKDKAADTHAEQAKLHQMKGLDHLLDSAC